MRSEYAVYELCANNALQPTIASAAPRHVTLKVFDLLGREVATLLDEQRREGEHSVQFDASGLTSGMYIYRLQAGASSVTVKKMVVLR